MEIQVVADKHGNVVHLVKEIVVCKDVTRILEESPSPIMTEELREMGEVAVKANF